MDSNRIIKLLVATYKLMSVLLLVVLVLFAGIIYYKIDPALTVFKQVKPIEETANAVSEPTQEIVDGIHVATGLKEGEGLEIVIQNCTACHSAKMVTQNRADREGWKNMIRWMQKTQKLWDLGENEVIILDYLAKNYPPGKTSRRAPLTDIEWYELED